MRTLVFFGIALAVGLAGCLSSPSAPTDAADAAVEDLPTEEILHHDFQATVWGGNVNAPNQRGPAFGKLLYIPNDPHAIPLRVTLELQWTPRNLLEDRLRVALDPYFGGTAIEGPSPLKGEFVVEVFKGSEFIYWAWQPAGVPVGYADNLPVNVKADAVYQIQRAGDPGNEA